MHGVWCLLVTVLFPCSAFETWVRKKRAYMRGVVGIVSKIFLQKIDGVRMKIKKCGLLFFLDETSDNGVSRVWSHHCFVKNKAWWPFLPKKCGRQWSEWNGTGYENNIFFVVPTKNCVDLPNHSTVHGCKHMEPTNTNTFNTFNPTTRQHTPTKILQSSHGRARVFHSSKLRWTVFILSRMIHGWMARCLCQHP